LRPTLKINEQTINDYCERQTGAQASLLELAEGIFLSEDSIGAVPDINGVDNFRLVGRDENLRLIDSEPIHRQEHPSVHSLILRQAEVLHELVS
jgi:hypothetical protein